MAVEVAVVIVFVAMRESWVSEGRCRFVADWARPAAAAAGVVVVACVGGVLGSRVIVVPPREATAIQAKKKKKKKKGQACGVMR